MTLGYYIYYRVAADQSQRAKSVIAALQDEVRERTGIRGRLLHRRDDPATWMEVYEGVCDGQAFAASLSAAVDRCGFSGVLAAGSRRITEVFEPV